MSRVKSGVVTRAAHKKVLKAAKGYYSARSRNFRTATQAVDKANQYATRDRKARKRSFRALWAEMLNGEAEAGAAIEVLGRKLEFPTAHGDLLRASFASLCATALGPNDYLAVAERFHTIFLEDVPALSPAKRDEARRFVTLVDALYEARRKLIILAQAEPGRLYPEGDGAFEFERTASRLQEMRSADWLVDD